MFNHYGSNPIAYRAKIHGNGYYREFDACLQCCLDAKKELDPDEEFAEFLGHGTSMHIEDMPNECEICLIRLR